jgi:hypothetical protein
MREIKSIAIFFLFFLLGAKLLMFIGLSSNTFLALLFSIYLSIISYVRTTGNQILQAVNISLLINLTILSIILIESLWMQISSGTIPGFYLTWLWIRGTLDFILSASALQFFVICIIVVLLKTQTNLPLARIFQAK